MYSVSFVMFHWSKRPLDLMQKVAVFALGVQSTEDVKQTSCVYNAL